MIFIEVSIWSNLLLQISTFTMYRVASHNFSTPSLYESRGDWISTPLLVILFEFYDALYFLPIAPNSFTSISLTGSFYYTSFVGMWNLRATRYNATVCSSVTQCRAVLQYYIRRWAGFILWRFARKRLQREKCCFTCAVLKKTLTNLLNIKVCQNYPKFLYIF